MSEKIYDVSAEWSKRAFVDQAKYREMYKNSVSDPNAFWGEQAKRVDWIKPFHKVENTSFAPGHISIAGQSGPRSLRRASEHWRTALQGRTRALMRCRCRSTG